MFCFLFVFGVVVFCLFFGVGAGKIPTYNRVRFAEGCVGSSIINPGQRTGGKVGGGAGGGERVEIKSHISY